MNTRQIYDVEAFEAVAFQIGRLLGQRLRPPVDRPSWPKARAALRAIVLPQGTDPAFAAYGFARP